MPTYLNTALREKLVKQTAEIYFPNETYQLAVESLKTMFENYCKSAFGPIPPFAHNCTYKIDDPEIEAKSISSEIMFYSIWIRAPFLMQSPSTDMVATIELRSCPISGFTDTVNAIACFLSEKKRFSEVLNSELLKYSTAETFLRRFPSLEGAFAQVIGEKKEQDLPNECTLDMSALVGFIEI